LRDWHAAVRALGVRELPLLTEIAIRASEIENLPGDPVDRIVVASALVEDAVLLTTDGGLLDWPGQVRRQDAQR
jgi:PIN domain nuclease of toxin-antitoxin system